MNGKPEEIVSILKEEISQYEQKTQVSETGSVVQVGDGIATVYGLENVMYGELLEFENGVRALAMNLETGSVGCALLGPEEGIEEGDLVRRTGRRADVPAGEEMLGRVNFMIVVPAAKGHLGGGRHGAHRPWPAGADYR